MSTAWILDRLYSLDTSSPEFLRHLFSLIHRDEEEQYLTSLQGSRLARLVDFLDKVHAVVEQRVVYSIYYNGTLVLPWRGERGVALAGCVWVRVE